MRSGPFLTPTYKFLQVLAVLTLSIKVEFVSYIFKYRNVSKVIFQEKNIVSKD